MGLSHVKYKVAEAEAFCIAEGNMCGTAKNSEVLSLRRGLRPYHAQKGTYWNLRGLMSGHRLQSRPARVGKARSRSR